MRTVFPLGTRFTRRKPSRRSCPTWPRSPASSPPAPPRRRHRHPARPGQFRPRTTTSPEGRAVPAPPPGAPDGQQRVTSPGSALPVSRTRGLKERSPALLQGKLPRGPASRSSGQEGPSRRSRPPFEFRRRQAKLKLRPAPGKTSSLTTTPAWAASSDQREARHPDADPGQLAGLPA